MQVELKSPSQLMAENPGMTSSASSSSSHLAPPLPPCRSGSYERPRSSGRPCGAGTAWSAPMMREHSPNPGIGMVVVRPAAADEALSNHSGSTRHRSGGGTPNSTRVSNYSKLLQMKVVFFLRRQPAGQ